MYKLCFAILLDVYASLVFFVTPVYLQIQFLGFLLNCTLFTGSLAIARSCKGHSKISNVVSAWSILGLLASALEVTYLGSRLLEIKP